MLRGSDIGMTARCNGTSKVLCWWSAYKNPKLCHCCFPQICECCPQSPCKVWSMLKWPTSCRSLCSWCYYEVIQLCSPKCAFDRDMALGCAPYCTSPHPCQGMSMTSGRPRCALLSKNASALLPVVKKKRPPYSLLSPVSPSSRSMSHFGCRARIIFLNKNHRAHIIWLHRLSETNRS